MSLNFKLFIKGSVAFVLSVFIMVTIYQFTSSLLLASFVNVIGMFFIDYVAEKLGYPRTFIEKREMEDIQALKNSER